MPRQFFNDLTTSGAEGLRSLVCPSVPKRRWELEQIQLSLGHVSLQTTERYLAFKQRIRAAGE